MLAIHVDPSLLTAPLLASSADEARDLLIRLTGISSAVTDGFLDVTIPSDCSDVLAAASAFPAFPSVQKLLHGYGLDEEFGTGDIVRIINNIIDRAHSAVELLDLEVVHLPTCNLTPSPWATAPGVLEEAAERALATVTHGNVVNAGTMVIAAAWSRCQPKAGFIHVDADADIDSASDSHTAIATKVVGTPPLVRALDDLATVVSPADVWRTATSPRDYHLAIALQASKLRKIALSEVPEFIVGSDFPQSLGLYQASGSQPFSTTTLDICAHVVVGSPKYALADFNQTRTRDNAAAFRTHVTKGGLALRLMLWLMGAKVEFANIGPKNHLTIESGSAARSYSLKYDLAGG